MLDGKSPQETAAAMKIKLRTVNTHGERLYKTLGIHDKMGLMNQLLAAVLRTLEEDLSPRP